METLDTTSRIAVLEKEVKIVVEVLKEIKQDRRFEKMLVKWLNNTPCI